MPLAKAKKRKPSYLEFHGQKWRVIVRVPPSKRKVFGTPHLKESLPTSDRREAEVLKWPVIARLKARLRGNPTEAPEREPLVTEAMTWREAIAQDNSDEGDALHALEFAADRIERLHGEKARDLFTSVATGVATPLDTWVNEWLREAGNAGRTEAAYRHAVRQLEAWCKGNNVPPSIEAIDARTAGKFVTDKFIVPQTPPATANKSITGLSSYWKWMVLRGHRVLGLPNPWEKQSVSAKGAKWQARQRETAKRPFTSHEAKTLWNGVNGQPLEDFNKIAALTGMRRDEIANLQARHIINGGKKDGGAVIHVPGTKTAAALRIVPVHSSLSPVIEARMKGKGSSDYLFDELPQQTNPARGRGAPISQAFTRERRRLGVDDTPEGSRQSRVDLHSWRRWFIRQAVEALERGAKGYTAWTIADVVGHDKEDGPLPMTMGRYPGSAPVKALRACVEAVRVPK
jgi:integrase